MSRTELISPESEPVTEAETRLVTAACAGDESAFSRLIERHRRELQVHCYRMLGSLHDAEDLLQETFLRAWRNRASFQHRSSFRTWLYRIATNACLDFLDAHPRRPVPLPLGSGRAAKAEIPWLTPYPDHLLEPVAPSDTEPDTAVVATETIELAFLAAIQHLSPRQRAVLILRDVLGYPAGETAAVLKGTVASVNSASQRARATMRRHLPAGRLDWAPAGRPSGEERAVLRRYMDAARRSDLTALTALLREDAQFTMPPTLAYYEGRDEIIAHWAPALVGPEAMTDLRHLATSANRQPAVATYVRHPGESAYRGVGLHVLVIDAGRIAEVTAFTADVLASLGLPEQL